MKIVDHNNFWLMADNPISKVGIYPYLGSQISDKLIPDKLYNVLRPAEEVGSEESLKSLQLLPIVDEHAMLGGEDGMVNPEQKGIHGVIGENVYLKDDTIYADLKIFSEALKEEIENGKKELSLGYFCDYDPTPGEYNGKHYDAVQRNLRGNHLALVEEGRMGPDVRIMDSEVEEKPEAEEVSEVEETSKLGEEPDSDYESDVIEESELPDADESEAELENIEDLEESEDEFEPLNQSKDDVLYADDLNKDPAFEEYLKGERVNRAEAYYSGPYDAAFEAYLRGE